MLGLAAADRELVCVEDGETDVDAELDEQPLEEREMVGEPETESLARAVDDCVEFADLLAFTEALPRADADRPPVAEGRGESVAESDPEGDPDSSAVAETE